jgi:hypothetical protein
MSYLSEKLVGEGLTYDDVLLVPSYSEVLPREVNIKSKFSQKYYPQHSRRVCSNGHGDGIRNGDCHGPRRRHRCDS